MMKNEKTKRHFLYVWVLASVPVLYPNVCLWTLFFVNICLRVGKESLWSFRLPSVFGKGEFSDSSRFWGEGEILTLVADQGHSFSPFFLFGYFFNGNVGAGSGFFSSFENFEKWMTPNNKMDPLCRPSMGKRRLSWTMSRGWLFGHDPRIFRWSDNPPYWFYTWTPPLVKFACIMRGGTRWWPDVMCS